MPQHPTWGLKLHPKMTYVKDLALLAPLAQVVTCLHLPHCLGAAMYGLYLAPDPSSPMPDARISHAVPELTVYTPKCLFGRGSPWLTPVVQVKLSSQLLPCLGAALRGP